VAVVYDAVSKQFSLYMDGVRKVLLLNCGPIQPNNEWYLGGISNASNSEMFSGYFDDVRLTVGEALYTQNFSPPGQHPIGEDPGFDADLDKVFSTYLYTGDRAWERSVNNNIDLLNNAGMVWTKCRTGGGGGLYEHALCDTLRGVGLEVNSDSWDAQTYDAKRIRSWKVNGYMVGESYRYNDNLKKYVSWTFLKEKSFFDMQTVTLPGGDQPFTFSHDLCVKPGMVFLKRLDANGNWNGYIAELGNSKLMYLNSNGAAISDGDRWRDPTDKDFTVGPEINEAGEYIAYLFADDKTDESVIKQGKYAGNGNVGNGPQIDLGWEPQWVMVKRVTGSSGFWMMADTKRGMTATIQDGPQNYLAADDDKKETDYAWITATPTGFTIKNDGASVNVSGSDYIYMAIRKDQSAFMRRLAEERDSE
jgi:hypothetical protein